MPGVGNKTRREIVIAVRILRERLQADIATAQEDGTTFVVKAAETSFAQADVANLSVDLLVQRVVRHGARDGDTAQQALHALLGLDPALTDPWPSQADVAHLLNVSRARVGQFVGKFVSRWAKEAAITKLRGGIVEILARAGGVTSVSELIEAVLIARGSMQDEPQRTTLARAVARACVEVEHTMVGPRFLVRRDHGQVLVASSPELAAYASRLGMEADTLADEDPLVSQHS